jgi:hypothetical protein
VQFHRRGDAGFNNNAYGNVARPAQRFDGRVVASISSADFVSSRVRR